MTQHSDSKKHQENYNRWQQSTSRQQSIQTSFSNAEAEKTDPFVEDLCDAFVASNIPFKKLNNPSLNKNPGLSKIIDIAKVLDGVEVEIDMAPNMIAALKYAPMTSCDVERSFSIYKNILADNRTSFKPENLEKYIICNCEKRE